MSLKASEDEDVGARFHHEWLVSCEPLFRRIVVRQNFQMLLIFNAILSSSVHDLLFDCTLFRTYTRSLSSHLTIQCGKIIGA